MLSVGVAVFPGVVLIVLFGVNGLLGLIVDVEGLPSEEFGELPEGKQVMGVFAAYRDLIALQPVTGEDAVGAAAQHLVLLKSFQGKGE